MIARIGYLENAAVNSFFSDLNLANALRRETVDPFGFAHTFEHTRENLKELSKIGFYRIPI